MNPVRKVLICSTKPHTQRHRGGNRAYQWLLECLDGQLIHQFLALVVYQIILHTCRKSNHIQPHSQLITKCGPISCMFRCLDDLTLIQNTTKFPWFYLRLKPTLLCYHGIPIILATWIHDNQDTSQQLSWLRFLYLGGVVRAWYMRQLTLLSFLATFKLMRSWGTKC